MLLRSSSTPVLGSLLSSVPESPNNNHYESKHVHHNKPPFPQSGSRHLSTFSCNSSPSAAEITQKGFRRARSVGNLETLVQASSVEDDDHDDLVFGSVQQKKFYGKHTRCLMLETIPSFSHHGSGKRYKEEEEDSDVEDGKTAMAVHAGTVKMSSVVITREEVKGWDYETEVKKDQMGNEEMFLAKGLGIGCGIGGFGGNGSGGDCNSGRFGGDNRDDDNVEEYYKKMVEENPSNPLFLRNYAQFLYQTKHDLERAEEYYSRAILADPGDGEILTQFAKLVWELHHDQDRASSYFERAVKASPEDSHVHAAYASFLWEIDEDENEENFSRGLEASNLQIRNTGHVTPIGA